MLSRGVGSWAAGRRVADLHGTEDITTLGAAVSRAYCPCLFPVTDVRTIGWSGRAPFSRAVACLLRLGLSPRNSAPRPLLFSPLPRGVSVGVPPTTRLAGSVREVPGRVRRRSSRSVFVLWGSPGLAGYRGFSGRCCADLSRVRRRDSRVLPHEAWRLFFCVARSARRARPLTPSDPEHKNPRGRVQARRILMPLLRRVVGDGAVNA